MTVFQFQALYDKDYLEAYSHQSQFVVGIVRILQNQKEQNWCLPLMYTVCLDLRLVAQKAEACTGTGNIDLRYNYLDYCL